MSEQEYEQKLAELEHGNINQRAIAIALRYGQIDGGHHKMWVIDQMVRLLAGSTYAEMIALYQSGDEGYEWDEGITP